MGLRITQGTLYARTLFQIQRSLSGSVRLQEQLSTGQRVNRPSDDPAATLRIPAADVRPAEPRPAAQQRDARARDDRYRCLEPRGGEHDHAAGPRADDPGREGTISASDRRSIGQEIDQLLRQMVGVANGQRAGRYLFGGTKSDVPPFVIEDFGDETRVRYAGNSESLRVGVAPGIDTELNIPGNEIFQRRNRQATSLQGDTGITTGVGLDTGVGEDRLEVTFAGLDVTGVAGIARAPARRPRSGPSRTPSRRPIS